MGQVDERTLRAVHAITGSEDPRATVELSSAEFARVRRILGVRVDNANLFPWFNARGFEDGYTVLNAGDTQRFMSFVKRASKENWSLERWKRAAVKRREAKIARFRNFKWLKDLADCALRRHFKHPFVVRYLG